MIGPQVKQGYQSFTTADHNSILQHQPQNGVVSAVVED